MHATENACMEANAMNTKACVRLARMDTNTSLYVNLKFGG